MKALIDFKNSLLKRREVKLVIESEKNPGMQEAAKAIAENFKVSEDVVAVKALKSKFGRKTFLVDAFIYDSVNDKNNIEPKKKKNKSAVPENK